MHPLLKRILWRAVPAAVVLGLMGYFLGTGLEMAVKQYNAELGGNPQPARQGFLVFGGLGFVTVAVLELLRWRRRPAAETPPKTYTVPPSEAPASRNGV